MIAIISGSHRAGSESNRIAHVLADKIKDAHREAWVLELATADIPFWDEGMWGKEGLAEKWSNKWTSIADMLKASEGIIVIAPEYHGMAPAILRNFLLLIDMTTVGHKPGLLIGVSGNAGGTYPVAELRATGTKNNRMCWIPDHLIMRNVGKLFKDGETNDDDTYMRERVDYTLGIFYEYVDALKAVRASGKQQTEKFVFGM